MKTQPRLRYYTRFRESVGRLRVVIWYKGVRKYISTPIIIARDQLAKLDSIGKLDLRTFDDCIVQKRIDQYTRSVWRVVTPLIDNGTFADTPSLKIGTAIIADINQAYEKANQRAKERFQRDAEIAKGYGCFLKELTPQEFANTAKRLRDELNSGEYTKLWEKEIEKGGEA